MRKLARIKDKRSKKNFIQSNIKPVFVKREVTSGLRYKVRTKLMEHKGYIYIPDLAAAA